MLHRNLLIYYLLPAVTMVGLLATTSSQGQDLGTHGYVDSGGVKLHYVTAGEGPLVVMIHGFPDYWYTWRNRMPALAEHFQVVAYDQRGYNKSEGVEKGADAKARYLEAFQRSSIDGMLNYYKANYPQNAAAEAAPDFPKVVCSVLMFHGLKDIALLPGALNDTWNWIDKDLTLITLPEAGHFVQHDAADLVTKKMVRWLAD